MSKVTPLDDIAGRIHALKAAIAKNIYELGRLLAQIHENERYLEAGYSTFSGYLEAELDLPRTTAYRAMDIYRHFSPEIARRYGVAKLDAGVRYLKATPVDERPGDLLSASIRLRRPNGRFFNKRFHDASATEILEATRLVQESTDRRLHGISARLRRRVDSLSEELPDAPASLRRGKGIRLRHHRDSGRTFASFTAIPLDSVAEFITVLRKLTDELPKR